MAISIDWVTKIIHIPQSYLTLSGSRYKLDIETFRNDLKNIEDSDEGLPYPDTHRRNAPVTLSGVVYTQTFEILSPYTVSFENTGTPYVVVVEGANHNIADVTNFDGGMSLVIGNSAGLIVNTVNIGGGVGTVSEVADAVWNAVASSFNTSGTTGAKLNSAGSAGDPWSTDLATYNTAGTAGKAVKDIIAQTDTLETSVASLPTASQVADAVWTRPLEATFTAEEILKIAAAILAGKVSGAGTGAETFVGLDGSTIRVVSNNDVNGNRTSVSVNGS